MPYFHHNKNIFFDKIQRATLDEIELFEPDLFNISLFILRLDKIDDQISGNKIFKLKYYLLDAITNNQPILTYGGAYSNHLAATSKACFELSIKCTGIVRGERPTKLSHTLEYCLQQNMQLIFISREEYDLDPKPIPEPYTAHLIIPEGGFGEQGVQGASEIKSLYGNNFTHVCMPLGTTTTFAGVISAATSEEVIGIDIVKDSTDTTNRLNSLINTTKNAYKIYNNYNFGGYAKSTPQLFSFMNNLYKKYNIPIDFVYTGKMMFGIFDLMEKGYFNPGSKILCIHTGGLQGNLSLPSNKLNF